jgi:SNF2 family DNA or RNA helicase
VPLVVVNYDPVQLTGRLLLVGTPNSSIWERLRARALEDPDGREISTNELVLSWPYVLSTLREYGTKQQQQTLGFRFRLEGEANGLARKFAEELKLARQARSKLVIATSTDEIQSRLDSAGFVRSKRELRPFQMRDLSRLLALSHGANFSVPGAGKTTVTLALHLLLRNEGMQLLVVGPKGAFPAWLSVVDECIDPEQPGAMAEQFTVLDGSSKENEILLRSGASRFLITYDLMVRQQAMLEGHLARTSVHLVLDEAHRMKAGLESQRGAFLLNVATIPVRRDILTGTPMPQGARDLGSQLAFLWPGHGYDHQIERGVPPRTVLGDLYVRTTKSELGLPKAKRHFRDVDMMPGQQALYSIVRSEVLRKLTAAVRGHTPVDFAAARRSVMRLLQLSANPILALKKITEETAGVTSGIIDAVLDEGPSLKMRAVMDHARELAADNKKVVIWTIFTDTLTELETRLADLNPVSLYGLVPSGPSTDPGTREARLARFHKDPACRVLIANPAAAGEGISLHTVCHDAIYLDRSYVSTHYLQSIDRIHRLGLPPGVETNIYIYRTRAPAGLGSIDYSVSRRLAQKIRGLEELLNDPDLHEIALDEETADDPVDYSVDLQDLVDLISELEGNGSAPLEENDT